MTYSGYADLQIYPMDYADHIGTCFTCPRLQRHVLHVKSRMFVESYQQRVVRSQKTELAQREISASAKPVSQSHTPAAATICSVLNTFASRCIAMSST